jgi:hypothetical protein
VKTYGGHMRKVYSAEAFYLAAQRVCAAQEQQLERYASLVPQVLLDELADQVEAGAVAHALGQLGVGAGFNADSPVLLAPGAHCAELHCCDEPHPNMHPGLHRARTVPLPPFHEGCDCALHLR